MVGQTGHNTLCHRAESLSHETRGMRYDSITETLVKVGETKVKAGFFTRDAREYAASLHLGENSRVEIRAQLVLGAEGDASVVGNEAFVHLDVVAACAPHSHHVPVVQYAAIFSRVVGPKQPGFVGFHRSWVQHSRVLDLRVTFFSNLADCAHPEGLVAIAGEGAVAR